MGVSRIWRCSGLFAATLLAYFPALRGTFLWNDSDYVTQPQLRSLHGLKLIWFKLGATEQYYPLLHSAFWAEHRLWGDSPLGYHLINIGLHALSACLVALILSRLAIPGAWLAGGIFALHPVAVESVAWISEQKNTLSLVFYLLAAMTYLGRGPEKGVMFRMVTSAAGGCYHPKHDPFLRTPFRYLLATTLFVFALLTKSVTATLPAALLVIIWWRQGSLSWRRDVLPLVPWLLLGAASGLFSAWVERRYVGAIGFGFGLSAGQRFLVAGRVVWFYLGKLLWPAHLNFIYPRWIVSTAALGQVLFPVAALALTAVLWLGRGRNRGLLAGWLFFAGSLFPVLGFFNVYAFIFSFVADHFQYLAALGIIVPAAAALVLGWTRLAPGRVGLGVALGAGLLGFLGLLTARQCGMYRDLPTFYGTIIERNPACWMAYNNLGNVLRGLNRKDEAIADYEKALRLRPDYPEAHLNLGLTLSDRGRLEEAALHEQEALRIRPFYPNANNSLGNTLLQLGRVDEAIGQFETALRGEPEFADAHYDLGVALTRSGRLPEAMAQYAEATRLDPGLADAHHNLANAFLEIGRTTEAVAEFRAALRIRPEFAEAHNGLGNAWFDQGRTNEARDEFIQALRVKPNYPEAHNNLGNALAQLGQMPESVAQFREALRLKPDYAEAYDNLAITLAQMGRPTEAAEAFVRALQLQPDSPEAHNNYGNVLRQLGRLAEARAHYEEALRLRPNYPEARDNLARLPSAR